MSLRKKIEGLPRWGLRAESVLQSMEPWNNGQYLLRANPGLRSLADTLNRQADRQEALADRLDE